MDLSSLSNSAPLANGSALNSSSAAGGGEKKPSDFLNRKKTASLVDKINDFLLDLSPVPLKEKLFFLQHLSVMTHAGISLLTALRTLSEQTENKTFAKVLKQVSAKIEAGATLSESLKNFPNVFDELFVNMIESGELSGKLEDVFRQLHLQLKKQYELTSKIKGALTYPVIIVCIMILIGIFIMIYVVPKIVGVFSESQVALPLPTRILIGASNLLVNNGLLAGLGAIILIAAIVKILQTEKGKYYFQALILRLPIAGPIIKKINLARFARITSSLLKTDIMIIETFRITAKVLGNLHYRKVVNEIAEKIKKGGQINEVIKNYPKFFPPIVTQMVVVGEQTGEIDSILGELAEFYENEIDQIMQNLPSIIEPILILALGIGVGGMALAVIMPMYALTNAI